MLDRAPGDLLQREPMRVAVAVEKAVVKDGNGREAEGVVLTCSRCGKIVEVFGTTGASARRGCVLLRESCDEKDNFYVIAEAPGLG
jgi:hypothetical protein